ncbi:MULTISPECIES: hypothetical protein [unclassified Moorena]|uniref:hypothetical protein n=1 Tax=unclassified Moorena TaxID=2683338 RepID=UPI0025804FC6|nr:MULTISPECIES: hypothetical protein [unclassified Moorena]
MRLLFAIGGIELYLSIQLSATQDFASIPDSRFPIPDFWYNYKYSFPAHQRIDIRGT